MNALNPAEIRYIKFGDKERWAKASLQNGEMHFGHITIPHDLCEMGDWEAVADLLVRQGRSKSKATDFTREIRDFYTLGSDCLWITFSGGHMWWAFAEPKVTWIGRDDDQGARTRCTTEPWRNTDLTGNPLRIDSLSTKLTQTAAYRQTLCSIKCEDYLLRRIRGGEEPILKSARDAKAAMMGVAEEMIADLHWADFEDMVDLIFSRTGWQRVSRVGGTQKDIDIELREPATGARAFVQVKSRAGQRELDDYIDRWNTTGGYEHMFFVCHSPTKNLDAGEDKNVHVWCRSTLAEKAISTGLFDWLTERSN